MTVSIFKVQVWGCGESLNGKKKGMKDELNVKIKEKGKKLGTSEIG